ASVWRQSHESFGTAAVDPTSTVALNTRFPGQYADGETGLHYNRFRYFSPATGRYINADPIGQLGGANTFSYAWLGPTVAIDPAGLQPGPYGLGNGPYGQSNMVARNAGNLNVGPALRSLAKQGVSLRGTVNTFPFFPGRPGFGFTAGASGALCFDDDDEISGFQVSVQGGSGAVVGPASGSFRLRAPLGTLGGSSRQSTSPSFPVANVPVGQLTGSFSQTNRVTAAIPLTPVGASASQSGSGPVKFTGGLVAGATAFVGQEGSITYSYGCTCEESP
ncbi:MAG: RHS repeat-associated core domain-containing protein, partial [bacterium]|nr:RHS repeat-associated core domain-containing protein [bacterium]